MKSRLVFFSVFLLITILYVSGCRRAGAWLVKDDQPEHSDAMILLMGGISDRVLQAADLYNTGLADKLFIVEENMGPYKKLEERGFSVISNTSQVKNAAIHLGIPSDSITVIEGGASSTIMEIYCVINYLRNAPSLMDTLVLVTSAQHTRRSSIILNTALKRSHMPVTVMCSPSSYSQFNAGHWWKDREGIQAVVNEYIKIAAFILFERRYFNK